MSSFVVINCDKQITDDGQTWTCPQIWFGPRRLISRRAAIVRSQIAGWSHIEHEDLALCPEHAQ